MPDEEEAPGAPTIRSAKPSPLMSPAEETELPNLSSEETPLMAKPLEPSSADRSTRQSPEPSSQPPALPKIT